MSQNPVRYTAESLGALIFTIRGQRVMLDADLACIYGVQTRRLNEQVRRNAERFPGDFMIQSRPERFLNEVSLRVRFAGRSAVPNVIEVARGGDYLRVGEHESREG